MAANKARLHTAEEIESLLQWAHVVQLERCLLDMVLNENLLFQWSPEGPQFFTPEKAPEESSKYSDRSPRPKMPLEWLQNGSAKCPICEEDTTCPHCKNKIILHVDEIAAGGVTSPGSQSSDEQPASKPKDTTEKLVEQPSNQLQISRLLDRLKEETKADPVTGGADIALWCLLTG